MSSSPTPADLTPDRVFDGGDLDCGSGLILLIREHMVAVPLGGILEMRSREPSVKDDLPPWCRMVGHAYLGCVEDPPATRFFIRRGEKSDADAAALAEDKRKAREYEWRTRTRSTGHLKSTVYCRNFSFDVGQAASFEEKDRHPSAVELLLGALGGSLSTAFATACARSGLAVDDIEITVRARLDNILVHLGLEDGDPGLAQIDLKCFASSLDDEAAVRAAWADTVARSPVYATLARAVPINSRITVM